MQQVVLYFYQFAMPIFDVRSVLKWVKGQAELVRNQWILKSNEEKFLNDLILLDFIYYKQIFYFHFGRWKQSFENKHKKPVIISWILSDWQ